MPGTAHTCTRCEKDAPRRYFLLGGQICNACYSALRRNPATCPSCSETRVLAFINKRGDVCCAECAGQPRRFACSTCGSERFLTGAQCGHCRLDERLQELLGNDGSLPPPLANLRDYLTTAPMDPRSIVRWLRRGDIDRTLRDMASGNLPIGHFTIDQLPPGPRTRYFRRLLIDADTLPPIPVLLHELNIFVDTHAAHLPREHAPILRRFHRWVVLPQLLRRYRDNGNDITIGVFTNQRSATLARARFLSWISAQGTTLADLDQSTLDDYLAHINARPAFAQIKDLANKVVHAYIENVSLVQRKPNPYPVGPILVREAETEHFDNALHAGYEGLNGLERTFARALDKTGLTDLTLEGAARIIASTSGPHPSVGPGGV
ncbi:MULTISPECIES: hypothetical protein [Bacteria]